MIKVTLTPLDLLSFARYQACELAPYFAKALWRMKLVESRDIPTMGISDRWVMYYNPDDVAKCAAEHTLAEALIHECMHPTLRHSERARVIAATDARRWNIAGDKEIGERIAAMVWPSGVSGRRGLPAQAKPPSQDVRAEPGHETWCAEEHYKSDKSDKSGSGSGKECHCAGGSGATGQPAPWESPDGEKGGCDEGEAEIIRAQVAAEVKKHVAAKGRGSVPAGILRWAEEYGTPAPIDWRAMLATRLRYQLDARRGPAPSYARPSRRRLGGLMLPIRRQPTAKICIVGDTSASMGDGDIGAIVATVLDAATTLGHVFALGCDTAAVDPVDVRCAEDLREALRGGGGTDMRVGIAKASEMDPDAIVVMTDGETSWPREAPDAPVAIVLTRASAYPTPAWAETIHAYET